MRQLVASNQKKSEETKPITQEIEPTCDIHQSSKVPEKRVQQTLFSRAEMNLHISKSGKSFDPQSKNHTVPTSMRKAKTFLDDEYLKEVLATSDDQETILF